MTTSQIESTPENRPLVAAVEQLQQLTDSLIEAGVLVHDNQGTPQSHQVLVHKFNQVIDQLDNLNTIQGMASYPIPVDIISYIEDGRNPDIYTREFVEVNAKSNARLKGKMENFGKLRDILSQKVVSEFPELKDTVEDIQRRTSGK
ncbi:RNA polymerase II mediator complex subunit [Yamadazyma tenuis]|uniref:Mediator of RNA polymerase II transcription subunit 10 n=1 Tax=Candida tenuis (strain ATCC 10573 / BCRC 21748 / CBS 615 / JCM 9827 / NBRC 10315 / NRRL Y-1498 / VKM Y-70) TaxID=590646 RepID=G3BCX2_CANTC|nr:uncharacterized protein CANTEDRAFT_111350 [Yamadazyma tenuis ATCC 10573]EGV60229.1 hypothetical protein CANTEDRAFT_111350 [Yamadazyma tenuis ATCC 10573]WEJ94528.1 RNA polymerase II mediator complex subunit [Yamadazyma tenuis]